MGQEAEDTRVVQELRSETKTYRGAGDCGSSDVSFVTETEKETNVTGILWEKTGRAVEKVDSGPAKSTGRRCEEPGEEKGSTRDVLTGCGHLHHTWNVHSVTGALLSTFADIAKLSPPFYKWGDSDSVKVSSYWKKKKENIRIFPFSLQVENHYNAW